jgi:hypothetical protein
VKVVGPGIGGVGTGEGRPLLAGGVGDVTEENPFPSQAERIIAHINSSGVNLRALTQFITFTVPLQRMQRLGNGNCKACAQP